MRPFALIGCVCVVAACAPRPPGNERRAAALASRSAEAGVYARGGVPRTDARVELILDAIPRVAWSGLDPADLSNAALHVPTAVGTPLVDVLPVLYRGVWGWLGIEGPNIDQAELDRLVGDVNRALAGAGLAYFVWPEIELGDEGRGFSLMPYHVARVMIVEADGALYSVRVLRRWIRGRPYEYLGIALGTRSAELATPLALEDNIEEHVVSTTLPVLVPDARSPYVVTAPGRASERLGRVASAAVRGEILAFLGKDGPAAQQIGELLVKRALITAAWALDEDPQRRDDLLGLVHLPDELVRDDPERDRLRQIDDELRKLDARQITRRITAAIVRSVAVHEVHHVLDARGARTLTMRDPSGRCPGVAADRGLYEVRAYLAQIVATRDLPHTNLWMLVGHAVTPLERRSDQALIGACVLDSIAHALGGPGTWSSHADGVIDVSALEESAAIVATATGAEVSAAARRAWQALFADPLPEMRVLP